MRRKVLAAAAVVAAYCAVTSFVSVDETEVVVVTLLGRPTRVMERAGLALKWPDPVQSVLRLDRRLQPADQPLGEYLTKDKKNVVAATFIVWRISDARRFIQSVRSLPAAEQRLSDMVSSELGAVLGTYTLPAILTVEPGGSKLPELAAQVLRAVGPQALAEYGISVEDLRLRRLGFPEQNLQAVYNRMRAERERIAKKYRAEGEEEAARIRTETDRSVRGLLAEAYRDAEISRGQGDAEATRIYAEAFQRDPAFYRLTRTLETYRKILDKDTTLILSSDAPLFRYLEAPPEVRE